MNTNEPAIRTAPKTCSRCKGTGSVTFTTYAGGFCMKCGGHGFIAGAESLVKSASIDGEFGQDALISIRHRAADHRPGVYFVSTTSRFCEVEEVRSTHDSIEAARAAANLAFRTAQAAVAGVYAARIADREARRAARNA